MSVRSIFPEPLATLPVRVLLPLALLTCFGATVLYSAAGGSFWTYSFSHLLRFVVFLCMALVISRLPRDLVQLAAYPVYGAILVLLLGVEALGAIGGGARRWLDLGIIRLQPSELMKPGIVLALATYYHSLAPGMITNWRSLIPAGVLIGMPVGLVILQPDLGTAMAIAFSAGMTIFLAGLPARWIVGSAAAAAVVGPAAFFLGLHDYQRARVTVFLNPESDPLGTGYHITQSQIAIGSGGIFGKGFGNGSQSHLAYLPEPHTDFVFATMAEEWGLFGGLFVLLIFGIVLRWAWGVARHAPDRFSRLLAGGMTVTIFFYVAINLLMVMGLAPVVGIPLPFMSHGGTSMMTNMICIGTLMMVERWSRRPAAARLS